MFQEGFLLGDIVRKEVKSITDRDEGLVSRSTVVKISSVVPYPQGRPFYDHAGNVNRDRVMEFLGPQYKKVVAWYKYKRSSDFRFTFREKLIHKGLSKIFDVKPELFTCCLLLQDSTENKSTHTYRQQFLKYDSYDYDRVPFRIINLSESNNGYKNSEPASETFNRILRNLDIDIKRTQGSVVINKIHTALQKHMHSVVKELNDAEHRLFELESEIENLSVNKRFSKHSSEDSLNKSNNCLEIDTNKQEENYIEQQERLLNGSSSKREWNSFDSDSEKLDTKEKDKSPNDISDDLISFADDTEIIADKCSMIKKEVDIGNKARIEVKSNEK